MHAYDRRPPALPAVTLLLGLSHAMAAAPAPLDCDMVRISMEIEAATPKVSRARFTCAAAKSVATDASSLVAKAVLGGAPRLNAA